ncbi:MAG: histidine--tRNA ligase [Pirellulaceae bacterium]|nr:histidine--tRNA ligase [Pirellulaceae bacterium]
MIPRERLIETARRVYRSYGFSPIDTPALEYLEVLQGKGGEDTDRQLYQFVDHGGRAVGLRFDLTVPLARFAAQHASVLGMPLRRYHIATVWRGENTQRGRYREFLQCDFDTIGTTSLVADIETALVIHDLLVALGLSDFTISINNRNVLNGLLAKVGLAERATAVLRALDKLGKIGPEQVAREMERQAGATPAQAADILAMCAVRGTADEVLAQLERLVAGSEQGGAGVEGLRQVCSGIRAAGVPEQRVKLDVSIARGLDYYTGTVFETLLDRLPTIGSVCSGGRYDNLAGLFTKEALPGVGASLGLDRLLAAMEELGLLESVATPAQVLLTYFATEHLPTYLQMAAQLRAAGLRVELYPEPKRLGQQLKYADSRGFRVALIAGDDEVARRVCQVKDLRTSTSQEAELGAPLVRAIEAILADDQPACP